MTQSFLSPAHVAGLSSHTRAAVREIAMEQICAGRGRVLQGITGFNRPRINPVRTTSVATFLPGNGRLLTARIERTQTQRALLAVSFFSLSGGHRRLISNLFRRLQAAGSPLLRSLVHDANQPTCGFFHRFQFAPIRLPSLLSAHESNVAKGSCHERQVSCKG